MQNTIQDMSEDIMMDGKMLKMEYKTLSAKLDISLDETLSELYIVQIIVSFHDIANYYNLPILSKSIYPNPSKIIMSIIMPPWMEMVTCQTCL